MDPASLMTTSLESDNEIEDEYVDKEDNLTEEDWKNKLWTDFKLTEKISDTYRETYKYVKEVRKSDYNENYPLTYVDHSFGSIPPISTFTDIENIVRFSSKYVKPFFYETFEHGMMISTTDILYLSEDEIFRRLNFFKDRGINFSLHWYGYEHLSSLLGWACENRHVKVAKVLIERFNMIPEDRDFFCVVLSFHPDLTTSKYHPVIIELIKLFYNNGYQPKPHMFVGFEYSYNKYYKHSIYLKEVLQDLF